MPLVGFEPTIPASERPQTYAVDRAATWTNTTAGNYSKLFSLMGSDIVVDWLSELVRVHVYILFLEMSIQWYSGFLKQERFQRLYQVKEVTNRMCRASHSWLPE